MTIPASQDAGKSASVGSRGGRAVTAISLGVGLAAFTPSHAFLVLPQAQAESWLP